MQRLRSGVLLMIGAMRESLALRQLGLAALVPNGKHVGYLIFFITFSS